MTDINLLYEYGAYQTISNILTNFKDHLLLSIIFSKSFEFTDDDKNFVLNNTSDLKIIILAMHHLSILIYEIFTDVKDVKTGISLLENLNTKHSNYILYTYYQNVSPFISNKYLIRSAQLGAIDAQEKLKSIGLKWDTEDQFCDHCSLTICPLSCEDPFGCGSDRDNNGWIYCNYLLCKIKTELDCVSIANYSISGFLSLLRILEFPLKLGACISSIVALGYQQAGYTSGVPIFISTGFTTLLAFVQNQEKQANVTPSVN